MTDTMDRTAELVDVNPAKLIVGVNVRAEARLAPEFVDSIRERGVLEPIVAYRGPTGQLVVLYGQRRTLAAVEAGRPSVPVMVVPQPVEEDRLVDQLGENDHRAPLASSERVAAFQQLAAIGVPAEAIAKRTAAPRAHVEAALKVAASEAATAAADQHPALTIEQAAGIAEFDADPDVVASLVRAAGHGTGAFDHELQRRRDDRAQAERYEAAKAELVADGVTVVDRSPYDHPKVKPLGYLADKGKGLTAAKHRKCPGAAVYLEEKWDGGRRAGWTPKPVCTDYRANGHELLFGASAGKLPAAELTAEEREAEKAKRRDVIESNKAWAAAQTVRRDWLRALLARKSAPKGAAAFIAGSLAARDDAIVGAQQRGNQFACELFGVATPTYGKPNELAAAVEAPTTEARGLVLALVLALAAYEQQLPADAWRSHRPSAVRYLRYLESCGYELSDVERRAVERETRG